MKRTYLGKILSITIATATILNLVACSEKAESSNSTTKAPETLTEIVAENTTVPTEYITEIVIDEEGNTQINTYPTTQSVANAKGQTQVSTIATQNSDSKVSQNVSKTVANNSTKTTTAKKSSQSSSSKQQKTTTKTATKTTTKTTAKTTVKYAGKGDERAVAQAVIKWINYYRVQEGKKAAIEMPGKATQYAVGRSKQLVTNFAHDDDDATSLATPMKYGLFYDSYEWNGKTIEGYYQCDLSSAIGKTNIYYDTTIDKLAKDFAEAFRNSKGHWSYVGDADGDGYNYIAVGVTLDGGFAYVDIEMATENIDNTGYYSR